MKIPAYLVVAVFLAGCAQAPDNTQAQATPTKISEPEQATLPTETSAVVSASATGTVEAVDAAAGKITIAHGPVDALKWPAMTMAFKATPDQIALVKAGQSVQFAFESKGMDATITRIAPAK